MKNLIFVWICLILAIPCQARTITVDDDGPADFDNIQAGINDANDGDEIIVSIGTYYENINFFGKNIILRSTDPVDPCVVASTIIDGNQAGSVVTFAGTESAECTLSGFTITNGSGTVSWGIGYGGGIYGRGTLATIQNNVVSGNLARTYIFPSHGCGGGISNCNGTIENNIISENVAFGCGGLGFTTGTASGGGLYNCSGTVRNNIISENTARCNEGTAHGGGLSGCHGTIQNNIISENRAICHVLNDGGARGGGLCSCGGTIENNVISNNSATGIPVGKVDIRGGGLYGCYGTIQNNCIFGNSAENGGGLFRCSNTIINCSIVGNAAMEGGGLDECSGLINNCIIWDNIADINSQLSRSRDPNYSCIQDWTGGGDGNIDVDPCFVNPSAGDYHLQAPSPCIDGGDPDYSPGPGETDIDGEPRVMGGRVDIGADEFTSTLIPVIRISPKEFVFYTRQNRPNPEIQILSIRNIGAGILSWKALEKCDWLDIDPNSGRSTGEANEVTVGVNIAGLTAGDYNCNLLISDLNAVNSPQTAAVILHILSYVDALYVPSDYETIQNAIDAAVYGDTVIVAPGTYTGDGNRDIDFLGKAITVRSTDPNDPNIVAATIIDCNGSETEPHRGFKFHNGEDANSILDGLTITRGYISYDSGGGIYCYKSGPTIKNCIINRNISKYGGLDGGGGVYCLGESSPTITGCVISENSAQDDYQGDGFGGGILCRGCSPTITNCTIIGNSANAGGGGIYLAVTKANTTINNCIITANNARSGGGINIRWSEPFIPFIANCIITANKADTGGGVSCFIAKPIINNCVINGNLAKYGGAMSTIAYSDSIITNCTISENASKQEGGAIFCYASSPTVNNSIVWRNHAPLGSQMYLKTRGSSGSNILLCYTDTQGGPNDVYIDPGSTLNWGQGNINADPCFVDPGYWADACDPNIIVEPNEPNAVWIDGDYHLLYNSPCIDTGDPNFVPEPNETDLDGNPRVVDGDNDGNSVVDMGAYERIPEPAELILDLADDVMALNLHKGISNSLEAKLNAALRALEDENENNDAAAVNTLEGFINAVEAQRGKKIPEAEADTLIVAAQEIIELLNDG